MKESKIDALCYCAWFLFVLLLLCIIFFGCAPRQIKATTPSTFPSNYHDIDFKKA